MDNFPVAFLETEVRSRPDNPFTTELRVLYVHQLAVAERARRLGLERSLMRVAEDTAPTLGCTEVRLEHRDFSEGAHRFYEALGLPHVFNQHGKASQDQPPLQVYAQLLDEDTCARFRTTKCGNGDGWPATQPESVPSWSPPPRGRFSRGHHQARGPVKGKYFDSYVMIDIYSRYIVGAVVHAHESGPLAVEMMKRSSVSTVSHRSSTLRHVDDAQDGRGAPVGPAGHHVTFTPERLQR